MLSPASNRSLRRLVAGLAAAASEDVQAVLAELDPRQRGQVEALLTEYLSGPAAKTEPSRVTAGHGAVTSLDGLSPWLAARLERSADPGRDLDEGAAARGNGLQDGFFGADYTMTPVALDALQAAAIEIRPAGRDAPSAAPAGTSRLLDRLHGLVLRGRDVR